MKPDAPTLKGTLNGLSAGTAERWRSIQKAIDTNDFTKPRRDAHPDMGQHAPGGRDRPGTVPLRQSSGQCAGGPQSDPGVSWYQIASDFISVGRALRLPGDEAAGQSVDDHHDQHRSVDIPSVRDGQ